MDPYAAAVGLDVVVDRVQVGRVGDVKVTQAAVSRTQLSTDPASAHMHKVF